MRLWWGVVFLCLPALSNASVLDVLISKNCDAEISVSMVKAIITHESKSFYKGKMQPWPWALNINSKGYYYTSKKEATDAALHALAQKPRRFGIGLGQIEWRFHKHRFGGDVSLALEPDRNIQVVCNILVEGKSDQRVDSTRALIAYYHRPMLDGAAYAYADKVLGL